MVKSVDSVRYELNGLDCANCALDIQNELNKNGGLETAVVDFAGGTIHFDPAFEGTVRTVLEKMEPRATLNPISSPETGKTGGGGLLKMVPIRLILSLPLFIAGIVARNMEISPSWPMWVFFIGSYTLAGYPVVFGAVRNIFRGRIIDELFLMTVATIGAFAIGELPEAVAVMLFYAVGDTLQQHAVSRSRDAIRGAMDLRVNLARLVVDGIVSEVNPESVAIDSIIEILPGDSVPLDGTVVVGSSWMDTSTLTGESTPRRFDLGDEVSAGFINEDGRLRLRVSREFGDSAISRVKKLLEDASSRKSRTEMVLSRFAAVYTPIVVGLAVLLALVLPLFFNWTYADSIYSAMVLLVISCPCALVVSVPLAYFAGIGRASREKALLRGSDVLDGLSRIGTLVFDKTGTLTEGKFRVKSVNPTEDWDEESLLETAAVVLSLSNHPIARSVREAWSGKPEADAVDSFNELRGLGVIAQIGGRHVLAGSSELLRREGVTPADPREKGSVVHLAEDGRYAGFIILADSLKEESAGAIREIGALGISHTVMLTGDRRARAQELADELGIGEVQAELLPEGKLAALEEIIEESPAGEGVAFIGDGLNDAAVILRSDVGMAMGGSGTDLAIEAADVIFMDDNPAGIPRLLRLSKFSRRIVIGNIVFALIIKTGFMVLGVFAGLPMWAAVIGDVGVAILAVLNSLRILYGKRALG